MGGVPPPAPAALPAAQRRQLRDLRGSEQVLQPHQQREVRALDLALEGHDLEDLQVIHGADGGVEAADYQKRIQQVTDLPFIRRRARSGKATFSKTFMCGKMA